MYEVTNDFLDYVCGCDQHPQQVIAKVKHIGKNDIEIQTDKIIPSVFGYTDAFCIMKKDIDKWLVGYKDKSLV